MVLTKVKKPTKKKLLGASGSEPKNFAVYTREPAVSRNNCMAFAFGERGRVDNVKQQPGNKSGLKGVNFPLSNCDELVRRVMKDYKGRVRQLQNTKPCSKGSTKVMAFLAPDEDFHFYRQAPDGYWEHKRGLTPASKLDACGKRIKNPMTACRNYGQGYNYKIPCATFCRKVSNTTKRKTLNSSPRPRRKSAAARTDSSPRPRRKSVKKIKV